MKVYILNTPESIIAMIRECVDSSVINKIKGKIVNAKVHTLKGAVQLVDNDVILDINYWRIPAGTWSVCEPETSKFDADDPFDKITHGLE